MKTSSFPTPEAAEFAFYAALESTDLETMMDIWETSEFIVCVHPLGPRQQGPGQIRESWQRIFASGTKLRFNITAVHVITQGDLAIRTVYENITVIGADEQPVQPVLATNIYRRSAEGWRIILHHASPGPASNSTRASERVH